uniref:protein-serine/threonine phosphatase n=1 Tax=Ciona savignyi TaxID=51511 RepID=H2YEF5_CIOSA
MLYVANAGDSRCVLCRKDGKALDMSNDHKPEDEIELKRITRAGGHVNIQGRVNGGLNLSRAIGDHCYKANPDLPLEEQMITAVPDVTSVKLEHTDEFLVLACDGIWNVKSSQDVTDFIKGELFEDKNSKLSLICEKLFDICLAPDTMGDGSGCDNMTCIIVQFNPTWLSSLQNIVKDPVVYHDNIKKNVKDFSSVSLVKATVKPNNDLKINNVKRSRTEDNDVTNNVPKHIIKNEPKRQKSI